MSDQWYYSRDGQEDGPFPYAVLQQMAKVGDLLATDKLREATAQEWRVAADFPDLFVTVEPRSVSSDSSSLKGLTMALGIEPAKPGHDPLLGHDIGGVTIEKLIAEGGMGRVYEGKQEKPNRTVAVKVMRPGLTSPSILKRFEYEAEVLGRLQHPGIAHIYSVGVHRMGKASVPYFVMEYIADAKSLTKYANELKLPIRQRLDLFRSVCAAVSHGHQKGVIHRDLKPSNILVDGSGQPKVIDFGVARATDSDMALTTIQTDVGQLIGTFQYMSPEQFNADPNNIDIRSDVYALGVILYELLAGAVPYDLRKKAVGEMARIVQQDPPTPLSSANRDFKGDLAIITGKCLEKDRSLRYGSASELEADIGRHLSGEPIHASSTSFIQALARLSRRHRSAAAAALIVLASMIAATVGMSLFALRSARDRARALSAQTTAQVAEERARANEAEAIAAREAAERQREIAVQAEKKAEAEASRASGQLYAANVNRLLETVESPFGRQAQAPLEQAVGFSMRPYLPPELAAYRAQRDATVHALKHTWSYGTVQAVFGKEGTVIATAVIAGPPVPVLGKAGKAIAIADTANAPEPASLWDVATGRKLRSFVGHEKQLTMIAFSPDGMLLAGSSADKEIHLWDVSTGKKARVLRGHADKVLAVAFSPDGKTLASLSLDKTCRLWSVHSGEVVCASPGEHAPRFAGKCLAWSPRGNVVATIGQNHEVVLWNASECKEILRLNMPGMVTAFEFSPDGNSIAVGSSAYSTPVVRLFDTRTGEEHGRGAEHGAVASHTGAIRNIAFSADGTHVITCGSDKTARLWSAADLRLCDVLRDHADVVLDARFSPNGELIATACADGLLRLWKRGGPLLAALPGHGGAVTERGFGGNVASVTFSPDGKTLASGSTDATARLWLVDDLTRLQLQADRCNPVAGSPDGRMLATGSPDGIVRLWSMSTAKEIAALKGHSRRVDSVAFGGGGAVLASDTYDEGVVRVWDVASGRQRHAIPKAKGSNLPYGTKVAVSVDGHRVAVGDSEGLRLWDISAAEATLCFKDDVGITSSVCIAPDGSRAWANNGGLRIREWDIVTQKSKVFAKSESLRPFESVALSHDARHLAIAHYDGSISLWDTDKAERVLTCEGHAGPANCVAFNTDGTRIISGGNDRTVRIWDAGSGAELAVLRGHEDIVNCVTASFLDGCIVSASWDGTARLWGRSNAEIVGAR